MFLPAATDMPPPKWGKWPSVEGPNSVRVSVEADIDLSTVWSHAVAGHQHSKPIRSSVIRKRRKIGELLLPGETPARSIFTHGDNVKELLDALGYVASGVFP